jgi:ATP-dependent RNA helicase RhlE
MSFQALGLSANLLRALEIQGYAQPTAIQAQSIPAALSGRDVLAGAQTGTGKTAAFVLPLLQRLAADFVKGQVRALILAPTRELAIQVGDSIRDYARFLPLRSTVIYGGANIRTQFTALRRGVEIVVATPGRLLDHMQRGSIDLSRVNTLVLDEADRMLDMGFLPDIERILKSMPAQRQTLLFSATFPPAIKKLAAQFLRDPVTIEIAREAPASSAIEQSAFRVGRAHKQALLSYLIGSRDWRQVLIFTRTKHGADRLAQQLERDGISATAIHGGKSQGARNQALRLFKHQSVRALVATDVAARGLDIDHLPHVVNFELPDSPEDYVHRIGRTGRAGRSGSALSLVSGDEHGKWKAIERLVNAKIPLDVMEGFVPDAIQPAPHPNRRRNPKRFDSTLTNTRSAGKFSPAPGRGERGNKRHGRKAKPRQEVR